MYFYHFFVGKFNVLFNEEFICRLLIELIFNPGLFYRFYIVIFKKSKAFLPFENFVPIFVVDLFIY